MFRALGLGVAAVMLSVLALAKDLRPAPYPAIPAGAETAILSMGCFWCAESAYEDRPGIYSVTSGHTGGKTVNPTYEQVGQGGTGHVEAILIVYDPKKVTYEKILYDFWRNIDPVSANGQFCDRGPQYRSAIWVTNATQRAAAEATKAELQKSGRFKQPIATEINDAAAFYPAERYHQDYAKENGLKYEYYRFGCGRDARLNEIWGPEARGGAKH